MYKTARLRESDTSRLRHHLGSKIYKGANSPSIPDSELGLGELETKWVGQHFHFPEHIPLLAPGHPRNIFRVLAVVHFRSLLIQGAETAGAQPCSCRAEMGLPLLRVKPGYTACIGCGSASLSDERFGRKDWWNGSAVAIS